MTLSIDQPMLPDDLPPVVNDDLSDKPAAVDDKQKQLLFQPTAFHKHIQLRQSNYAHHNNLTHTSNSTFGTGRGLRRKPTKEIRKGELPPSLTNVVQSNEHPREGRLAQTFDEMVACRNNSVISGNGTGFCRPRVVFSEAWAGHDGRSILSPTIGGGVSAMWRMTGLLSRSMEGKPPANSNGGGWSMSEVVSFLHYHTPLDEGTGSDNEEAEAKEVEADEAEAEGNFIPNIVQKFDAVVFRVMHGWMRSNEITHDRLVEAVELSHELLGAETVVLMTIPFSNNVLTVEDMNVVNRINADIRHIAQGWHLRNSTGVKHVLVQEYGAYLNHIIWSNAKHIGFNVSAPLTMTEEMFDLEGPTFLYDRLETGKPWKPSIAQVCSEQNWLRTEKAKCHRNYLIIDGMHICPETLAARYGVSVACLLGCVYNRESGVANQQQHDEINLRACERECNEQFMSVMPVDDSWIDSNTELASFAT
eukprot:scaffold2568_cov107-Skeletonema_dohrnii-CCMP3373.AAC.4